MNIYQIIGLLFLMVILPIPIGWILIHKTINFWRKLGKASYSIIIAVWIIFALIVYQFKDLIIGVQIDYLYLRYIGVVFILVALCIDYLRAKVFSSRYLIGLPEIQNKSKLITSGIYSKIRHPRYLSYIIAYLGLAFFTQLLSLFIIFPMFIVLMYILTLAEEKELIKRFGKEYAMYMKRTPRFLPSLPEKLISKKFLLLLVVLNFIGIIFSFLTYANEFVDYAQKKEFISMIFFPVSFWLYLLAFFIVLYKYLNKKIPKFLGGLAFVYCFAYGFGSLIFYPLFMAFVRGVTLYHAWNVLAHGFVGLLSLLFLSWITAPRLNHLILIAGIFIIKDLFDIFGKGFLYFIEFAFPAWLRASLILMIIGLQVTAFYLLFKKTKHLNS